MLQAAKKRHRSVSESASVEESSTSRERRLSGGCSTVTLPIQISSETNIENSMQKSRLDSTSSSQYRTRAGSFGSSRLHHHHLRRRNDSAPSCSQRDLNKQQSRSRQNSGSKSHEVNKSQGTARERTQTNSKSEASKSVTIKAESSSSQK